MNFMDKAKDALEKATKVAEENIEKAKKATVDNPDKVRGGIDKVGGLVNNATSANVLPESKPATTSSWATTTRPEDRDVMPTVPSGLTTGCGKAPSPQSVRGPSRRAGML